MSNAAKFNNPHFRNPERAPYELGHLLMALPANFAALPVVDESQLQVASAAVSHAYNANSTVLHGIEAIGQLMESAGAQSGDGLSAYTVHNLGSLLRHLAVEAQFLCETDENLSFAIDLHQQGGKHGG